jgi:hypothetical protein
MRPLHPEGELMVRKAAQIIGPAADKDVIRETLRRQMPLLRRLKTYKDSGLYGVLTKEQKTRAANFRAALSKLKLALYDPKTGERRPELNWAADFPVDEIDLDRWEKLAQKAADTDLQYRRAKDEPAQSDQGKLFAADIAATILEKHDLPITGNRTGTFVKLAALIYGDGIHHYCDDYLKTRTR